MPDSPATLFERHHLVVFRYLLRLTGRRDVAEDLTQEVFLRVVRGIESYDHRGFQRAWLISIARNLAIDRHRKSGRQPVEVQIDVPAAASDPAIGLDIRKALASIPVDERDALVMRVVAGLGHQAIADIVGTTPAAVRSRIHRARVALRSLL